MGKNSGSTKLWRLVIIGSWEGVGEPIDENASGTKSRMVYTSFRHEGES
jgi:hypothetical protein